MRVTLKRHPEASAVAHHVFVDVARPLRGVLALRYDVWGATTALKVSPPAPPARRDELWRHTCFEAFVRVADSKAYYEFNFSPSTQWAAYRFLSYREGMSAVKEIAAPQITLGSAEQQVTLDAVIDVGGIPELAETNHWLVGLSAVLENVQGAKSYWALKHAPGKPDFHHADGFVLELP